MNALPQPHSIGKPILVRWLTLLTLLISMHYTSIVMADTRPHPAVIGTIDSIEYERTHQQLHIHGWVWDSVTAQPAASLRVAINGEEHMVNPLPHMERPDVKETLKISLRNTGFAVAVLLNEPLSVSSTTADVTAVFVDGRSFRMPAKPVSSIPAPATQPPYRHWILLALVLGWLALAYIPQWRSWSDRTGNWVKRYPSHISVAIVTMFALSVAFGITGSSVQLLLTSPWNNGGDGTIAFEGQSYHIFQPRGVRTDEWLVVTPSALAQWNHTPPFPVINTNLGLEGQNMGVIGMTGVPVAQPAALARVATWGYFFLPLRQAMSWHWQLPFFGCLLFLWLTLNLLRPSRPGFNLLLSITFCVAPYAAGWSLWPLYATFLPLALFVLAASLLRTDQLAKTVLLGVIMGILLVGWALVLYPPWQVSVGTFMALLAVGWVADHWRELQWRKAQWLGLGLALAISAALMGSWWKDTANAIAQMQATVYPGSRVAQQGADIGMPWWTLRGYLNTDVLTFSTPGLNQSEISAYLLLPLPMALLGLWYSTRNSSHSWTLRACLAFLTFWLVFRFVGLPLWLTKITLWNHVTSTRLDLVMGLACTMLVALIYTRPPEHPSKLKYLQSWPPALCVALVSASLVSWELHVLPPGIPLAKSQVFQWAMMLAIGVGAWWMMRGRMRSAATLMLLLNLVATLAFNPISRAPNAVTLTSNDITRPLRNTSNHPLIRTLVISDSTTPSMMLAAVGVPTVGGVLYYPHRSLWSSMGLPKQEWPVVNRYQHLTFSLTDVPSAPAFRVKSSQADTVIVTIHPQSFDFASAGAQRVAAQEKDAALLRASPALNELGQSGGWVWFAVQPTPLSTP